MDCKKRFVVCPACVRLTRGPAKLLVSSSTSILRNCPLTLYDDISGLDGDLDPLGDVKQFLGVAVPMSACVHAILYLYDAGGWRVELAGGAEYRGCCACDCATRVRMRRQTYMYFILRLAAG